MTQYSRGCEKQSHRECILEVSGACVGVGRPWLARLVAGYSRRREPREIATVPVRLCASERMGWGFHLPGVHRGPVDDWDAIITGGEHSLGIRCRDRRGAGNGNTTRCRLAEPKGGSERGGVDCVWGCSIESCENDGEDGTAFRCCCVTLRRP